ncbi:AraC family transcriptional regulator [Anaerocolumna sp. MB42-C2]|uniref:AraC family transcriptional regulator n=1 Tax=Anaerocolumna sp. MB42-C2 TaxID=3070997 RepID=UPI0027DFFF29|nr:AraC family transcriptional regulator [Anaerocolumna sp. MB42-C2]WMJ87255.1 AraC family transcriptional regulator [Anaerocolumna sp. MB42-C2]
MILTNASFENLEFEDGCYINVSLAENTEAFPSHWHKETEIILPLEGNYLVHINGVPYHLGASGILFISPGELHEMPKPMEGSHMILQFNFSLINNLKDFNFFSSIFQTIKLITKDNDPDIHKEILYLMLEIREEYISGTDFKNAIMYSKLLQIYVLIARKYTKMSNHFPDITTNKHQEYMAKFTQIFSYINDHYTEDLTLESIAQMAGFSKFHFSRLFKQLTNMSINDYVNLKRITEAEVLLLNPNLSITEVSMQAGFNCLSTFNRAFKEAKKCTPTEFKKLYIPNENPG